MHHILKLHMELIYIYITVSESEISGVPSHSNLVEVSIDPAWPPGSRSMDADPEIRFRIREIRKNRKTGFGTLLGMLYVKWKVLASPFQICKNFRISGSSGSGKPDLVHFWACSTYLKWKVLASPFQICQNFRISGSSGSENPEKLNYL